MKYKYQIIKHENKSDDVKIEFDKSWMAGFNNKRDSTINDKIYPDENELIVMKAKHNKELHVQIMNFFKELFFIMSSCDIAVNKAVKPLLEKNAIQEVEILELKNDLAEQKNEFQSQINELQKQIQILMKNK